MPVPFEALLPYGLVIGLMCVSGAGLGTIRYLNNGGKRSRYNITQWDQQMMERDRRLTGYIRGQSDKAEAPSGFELNKPWKIEYLHGRGPA